MKKKIFLNVLLLAFFVAVLALVSINKVHAHCDTLAGPVVRDAKIALEKGDVTPVLKWVKKENEPEIRTAFNVALTERKKNAEAKDKADIKFFETLVRVHRATEGEPFTGLKPASSIEPIIVSSDKALETSSVDNLAKDISNDLINGIKERFDRALEKKKHKDESVEAGREFVEAYVEFTHYVERLDLDAKGQVVHHPGIEKHKQGEPKKH